MTNTAPADLIGTEEAAAILGITKNGVIARVLNGKLTPLGTVGRRATRVFLRSEIEAIAAAARAAKAAK